VRYLGTELLGDPLQYISSISNPAQCGLLKDSLSSEASVLMHNFRSLHLGCMSPTSEFFQEHPISTRDVLSGRGTQLII
jgi:hypothetical protein